MEVIKKPYWRLEVNKLNIQSKIIKMVLVMKERNRIISVKDLVDSFTKTVACMMEDGIVTWCMVVESYSIETGGSHMMEIGKKIDSMDSEHFIIRHHKILMKHLIIRTLIVLENCGKSMMESLKMIQRKVLAY